MEKDIEVVRHSLSHVLAAAVLDMFPEAKLGVGPAIDNGFYYDFKLPRTLIPEDLAIIEKKMKAIIKTDEPFEKAEVSIDKAIDRLSGTDREYKLELLEDLRGEGKKKITIYI